MNDGKTQLSRATVALHWIVGIAVIALLASGIIYAEFDVRPVIGVHKSIGVIIFAFILARVVWRVRQGWPEPVRRFERWERWLSRAVHYVLIIGTVLMPMSGMAMSGAGGYGIDVFGWELFPANPDPDEPGRFLPLNGTVAGIAHEAHGIIGYIMLGALALHIAGALKHHFADRDGTLRRMLGAKAA